jgi:hypothetical protein
MTMQLFRRGSRYPSAALLALVLLVACSRPAALSLAQAQGAAKAALVGYSSVQLTNPILLESDRPGAQYRLRCALRAEKEGIVVNLPTAVFYYERATDGTFHVDASGPTQNLNETSGAKTMFSRDALRKDDERVKKWQQIP